MRSRCIILLSLLSSGCGGVPTAPYVEPPAGPHTANVRVITNASVYGDSLTRTCSPLPRHTMAIAGRGPSEHQADRYEPAYPSVAPRVAGMLPRAAPALPELPATLFRSHGPNLEMQAEYRVRTDVPFLVFTPGAVADAGSLAGDHSKDFVCRAEGKVFDLEPGRDYELVVGMAEMPVHGQAVCVLHLGLLLPGPQGGVVSLPQPGRRMPEHNCQER